MFKVPEQYRITDSAKEGLNSTSEAGNNGAFIIGKLRIIASDGGGWDHVSVSKKGLLIPTWAEMCKVKRLFWSEEDVVMQLHPAQSHYVNIHPGVLHLWRPQDVEIPLPPLFMV